MKTLEELMARNVECQEIIAKAQSVLVAARGLTDDSTDAEWDAVSDTLKATVPEMSEMHRLTIEIETREEKERDARIAARQAARIAPQLCPRHHIPLTSEGCPECDDQIGDY